MIRRNRHARNIPAVIVKSDKVGDKEAAKMARDIAREIEQELNYPGEIRVTLIRETRVIEYAR